MEGPATSRFQTHSWGGIFYHLVALMFLASLQVIHGVMILRLFSPEMSARALVDNRPILSGRHALHLYHGYLGAQSFFVTGRLSCIDPGFQAGYPKTPVFDSGCRPAELFCALAGGGYQPAAYKLGLALCCWLGPLLIWLGARGVGLMPGASCLAVALGLVVWWATPCRDALLAGDEDLILGSLCAVAHVGLLIGYNRSPGIYYWVGQSATACLGLFIHPPLFVLLLPITLVYYLSVGVKHGLLWHVALGASLAATVALNAFWLGDWVTSWWLRLPFSIGPDALVHRTIRTIWESSLWGWPSERLVICALIGLAVIGVGIFNCQKQRPAARVLGMGALGFLALALAGIAWKPLGRLGTSQLLIPALWFSVYPAVCALARAGQLGIRWTGLSVRAASLLALLIVCIGGASGYHYLEPASLSWHVPASFTIGLTRGDMEFLNSLKNLTTSRSRILWEERTQPLESCKYSPLLPLLTERSFIGGLGPDLCIEHAYPSLVDQILGGKALADWSDADLAAHCRRYNIGWIVCWSPTVIARLQSGKVAKLIQAGSNEENGWVFQVSAQGFASKGRARLIEANCQQLVLADVVPEEGQVVLCFHYHAGMIASPSRVLVERDPDPSDPIPFIRLRVPDPVAHLTLTWNH